MENYQLVCSSRGSRRRLAAEQTKIWISGENHKDTKTQKSLCLCVFVVFLPFHPHWWKILQEFNQNNV
jgi:hypothetical protein